jgi:predicted phage tail protein
MGAAEKIDIHGAKGGDDKPKTPTEAPDSLRSIAVAKMLIAIGEGEFEGTPTARDIYLDNTPLQDPQGNMNFPNVKWEWRTGAVDQTYIQGIPSVENETTVSTELRSGTPWVRAISNTQLSAVRVRFAWPALQAVDADGNINGYRIEYKVELATDGGAYQQVLSEAADGKTTSTYERTRRIDLPKATSGWLMRVTRVTENKNNNKISDTMQIAGFTEVIDAKIRYPNTALLYIEFSAEQFRSIPAVTVSCKARKWPVPSNYDPVARTYIGIWDGTFKEAYTNNPCWATRGITINDRFGLGRRIKSWMVDKWELYRISQYCDQLVPDGKGGMEPRFICNLNLQSKADAWSLLRDISAIYRGMTYWAQGQVFTLSDMPRSTDFDFAYTGANVITEGKPPFTYSSSSERTRYTRALVSYDNPLNNYDTDVTSVTDAKLQRRYGDNPLEISAIGCDRESEAQRRGKWALLTNSKDRAVIFRVGLDGRIPLPGYVIPIADELLAGRAVGGRISAVEGLAITLDRDTQAKAGDRLILNLPNGKCEGRTVQAVDGRQITVTTAYSVSPERELIWALDADDLAIPLYRVVSVARPETGVFEISAVQYDPSKFAHIDTGARLEERPISVIPITVVQPPASVALTATSAIAQGLSVATMNIVWPAVNGAVSYDVEWRKDSGNWIKLPRTGATSVDVVGIYAGAYLARVRAVSAFDISSIWKNSDLTQLSGKTGLPPAVTSLTTTSLLFGIQINWAFPPGAEDTQRTELWYGTANDISASEKLADLAYPQADYSMQQLKAGATLFFWARLVDRSGNIGPFFPVVEGVMGQASTDATAILDQIAGQLEESALGEELLSEIGKIDGNGPGSVNERLAAAKALSDQLLGNLATQLGEVNEELQGQIDQIEDLADSAGWKDDRPYTSGQSVIFTDGFLYQATKDVPVNTPPPNTDYWLNVGQAVSTANGLAARTQTIETKVTEIEGVNTTQATQITGLRTDVDGKASGTAVSSLTQRVTTAEGSIASQGTALTGLSNTVAGKADAQALTALTTRVTSAEGVNTSQGNAITSLNNSLAGKANSSTVTTLSNTVSEQGVDLTAQGNALTNIKANLSGIRGDSINLIPDTYSWLGTTLPTIAVSSTAVATSVDASVPSGNRFRVVRGEVAQPWIMMAASNNAAGWNVTLKAGTYLLSFWANTNGAGITNGLTLRAAFWDGSSRSPTDFRLTGDRVRYTAVITVTAESQGAAVFFVPAGAAGDVFWIDSVMIEARVGTSNVPSAFVSGPSITSAANAAAISLLNAAVTRQGQDITSASQAVTQLSSSIGGTGVNLLPDTYSWIASAALPAIGLTAGLSLSGLSGEAGSVAGGAIRIQTTDTNTNRQFMLIPVNSDVNGRNIPVEPGTYLVSFFAYSNQNVTLRAGLWDSTGARLGATKVIGTARVRHTFVVTITVAGMAAVIVYPSTDGVSGVPTVYYSFMVEKQIGGSIVPSPFTPGSSASSVTGQASAISATQATVGQQGAAITSMSSRIDSVTATAGSASATAQQALTTASATDGELSAMYTVKLGVTSNGYYYPAGFGLGIENGPAGLQSTFAVMADKFVVLNGTGAASPVSPFSILGGQTFINAAIIQDGTITNAKIGSFISSTNYVAGQQGWILNKNGTLEINGVVSGSGRLVVTNRSVRVFDANGVKRVQLGDLTE